MRILCVTNLFPNALEPLKATFNLRLFLWMQRLAALQVISPLAWTDDLKARLRRVRLPRGRDWSEWGGIRVIYPRYFYTPKVLRNHYGWFMRASIAPTFHRAVREFRPELIFACWAYPDGWAACRLARTYGLPVVIKVHGSDLLLLGDTPARQRGTIEALRDADGIVAVSRHLAQRAVELGAASDRVHVVYEGTDVELFSPGEREAARRHLGLPLEGDRVLFVGNLVPVKGIENLIDASRQLLSQGIRISVDIVGAGPLRRVLQRKIDDLGIGTSVRLVGPKPQSELPHWYRSADLIVLPSYSEGVPNVLVEAAACGRPFVATTVGGIGEISHLTSSRLVPPGNPRALAEGIVSLLRSPGTSTALPEQRAIPSTVQAVNETLEIFSDLLEHPRSSRASAGEPAG